jgi:CBS domain-containing protein
MTTSTTQQVRVKDVMSKHVVAVSPVDTLYDAIDMMVENRVSALPVIDAHERCVGMLSTTDLIDLTHELEDDDYNVDRANANGQRWLYGRLAEDFGAQRVSEQMTLDVATIGPETSISDAASAMLRNRVHRLPVVDEKQRLLGILSTTDIVTSVANWR